MHPYPQIRRVHRAGRWAQSLPSWRPAPTPVPWVSHRPSRPRWRGGPLGGNAGSFSHPTPTPGGGEKHFEISRRTRLRPNFPTGQMVTGGWWPQPMLYSAAMRLSCGHEIDDGEILRAAASLRSRKRKHHHGGRPFARYRCPRCGVELLGKAMFHAHLSACPAPPPTPMTPEDLTPWKWTPDAA